MSKNNRTIFFSNSLICQLPPLSVELQVEAVEIIWLYAVMSKEERRIVYEFIQNDINDDMVKLSKIEQTEILNDIITDNPEVIEFTVLTKALKCDNP